MRKRIFFISASLLTGIIGASFLHRKKKSENQQHLFAGDWVYQRNNQDCVEVTLTPALELYIQEKHQPVTIVEQSPHRLAFLDTMGYQIVFEEKENQLFFFDETEDVSFVLRKK